MTGGVINAALMGLKARAELVESALVFPLDGGPMKYAYDRNFSLYIILN